MATARKLPSGSWRCQVYTGRDQNGKQIRVSFTAPTKREAELQAAQFAADNTGNKPIDRNLTVKEAIERYITAKTQVLSPSTIRAYRSYQRTHYEGIGAKSVFKLSTEDMQLFVSGLTGKVSAKTAANVYGLLSSSIALFRPDTIFRVTLPKRKKERHESPSDDLVAELFKRADPELKKCIALAAFGSLRRGEVCALRYQDIKGNTIFVHADMVMDENGNWVYKDIPKTSESNRQIIIPDELIDMIGDGPDDDYVISINPGRVSDRFIKLKKRIGYDVRFHDLRHYFASIGAVIGIPDTYLSMFGGWRPDSPVMKNVYQNVISDERTKFASIMTNHFSSVISAHESAHKPERTQ